MRILGGIAIERVSRKAKGQGYPLRWSRGQPMHSSTIPSGVRCTNTASASFLDRGNDNKNAGWKLEIARIKVFVVASDGYPFSDVVCDSD